AASLHAGIATGPGELRNHDLRLSRWDPKIGGQRRNRQKRSYGASKQCCFHCDPTRSLTSFHNIVNQMYANSVLLSEAGAHGQAVPPNCWYQVYCSPIRALNHGHPGEKLLMNGM